MTKENHTLLKENGHTWNTYRQEIIGKLRLSDTEELFRNTMSQIMMEYEDDAPRFMYDEEHEKFRLAGWSKESAAIRYVLSKEDEIKFYTQVEIEEWLQDRIALFGNVHGQENLIADFIAFRCLHYGDASVIDACNDVGDELDPHAGEGYEPFDDIIGWKESRKKAGLDL